MLEIKFYLLGLKISDDADGRLGNLKAESWVFNVVTEIQNKTKNKYRWKLNYTKYFIEQKR